MSRRVIVVWMDVPERTRVFAISDLTDANYQAIKACHNMMIGGDIFEDELWLADWMQEVVDRYKPVYDSDSKDNKVPWFSGDYELVVTGQLL